MLCLPPAPERGGGSWFLLPEGLHVCIRHDHGPSAKAWPGADPLSFHSCQATNRRCIVADRVPTCLIKFLQCPPSNVGSGNCHSQEQVQSCQGQGRSLLESSQRPLLTLTPLHCFYQSDPTDVRQHGVSQPHVYPTPPCGLLTFVPSDCLATRVPTQPSSEQRGCGQGHR